MPGGKVIYALVDKRTCKIVRQPNDKPAVYSSHALAADHINDWNTNFHKGSELLQIVWLAVSKDFKFYRKEGK